MPVFRGTFFQKVQELSVSVFEICAELWVPFSKNITKLLEGRLSINKNECRVRNESMKYVQY